MRFRDLSFANVCYQRTSIRLHRLHRLYRIVFRPNQQKNTQCELIHLLLFEPFFFSFIDLSPSLVEKVLDSTAGSLHLRDLQCTYYINECRVEVHARVLQCYINEEFTPYSSAAGATANDRNNTTSVKFKLNSTVVVKKRSGVSSGPNITQNLSQSPLYEPTTSAVRGGEATAKTSTAADYRRAVVAVGRYNSRLKKKKSVFNMQNGNTTHHTRRARA